MNFMTFFPCPRCTQSSILWQHSPGMLRMWPTSQYVPAGMSPKSGAKFHTLGRSMCQKHRGFVSATASNMPVSFFTNLKKLVGFLRFLQREGRKTPPNFFSPITWWSRRLFFLTLIQTYGCAYVSWLRRTRVHICLLFSQSTPGMKTRMVNAMVSTPKWGPVSDLKSCHGMLSQYQLSKP